MNRRVHLRIHGLVQGVSYRACACDEARRLGVLGWVRNLPEGGVESVAEGAAPAIDSYVAWCGHGPAGAAVEAVAVTEQSATGEFRAFAVVR